MAKKGERQRTIPGTDTGLSKACDALLAARKKFVKAENEVVKAQTEVTVQLKKAKRERVRHQGKLFTVRHRKPSQSVVIYNHPEG